MDVENAVVAIIAAVLITGGGTWKYQEHRYAAKELVRVEAENKRLNQNEETAEQSATRHEVNKAKIATKYVVVKEIIENVVTKVEYRDRICLDADGLRAHASAVALTHPASESENSMPAPPIP